MKVKNFCQLVLLATFIIIPGQICAQENLESISAAAESDSAAEVVSDENTVEQQTESEGPEELIPSEKVEGISVQSASAVQGENSGLEAEKRSAGNIKIEADQMSGALNYALPINLPAGRNGLQPELSINYSSQNTDNTSFFGYGWSLNIPKIERLNRTGTQNLYTQNNFTSSLSGELKVISLNDSTHGLYGAEIDQGQFLNYQFLADDSWLVTTKSGLQYKFGLSLNSRQTDPADSSRISSWYLEEVRDLNDNFIRYQYFQDQGQIYPEKIFYTGHGVTDGIFEVEFVRESRLDNMQSFKTGFAVQTDYRIKEIIIKINGAWLRKYQLDYNNADNEQRSLLVAVTESAKDETSGQTITLPPNSFTYQQKQAGWTQSQEITLPKPLIIDFTGISNAQLADVNGDGLDDLIYAPYNADLRRIYLNIDGGIHWEEHFDWDIPFSLLDSTSSASGIRLADVNGDNFVDAIFSVSYPSERKVFINRGNNTGWEEDPNYTVPVIFVDFSTYGHDTGARLADINGDNLVDIVWSTYWENQRMVYLNKGDGTGWQEDPDWIIPRAFVENYFRDDGTRLVDINADGLPDIVHGSQVESYREVYLNNGSGWVKDHNWEVPVGFCEIYQLYDWGARLADINADGLVDIVYGHPWPEKRKVYLNTGKSWVEDPSYILPNAFVDSAYGRDKGGRLSDINGDGLLDFIYSFYVASYRSYYLANPAKADLLSEIETAQGSKITITYQTTVENQDQNGNFLNPDLPFILETVEEINFDDGLGNTYTENYLYAGGEYYYDNPYQKKFAGFAQVVKTDAQGSQFKTYYHQGNYTDSANGEFNDDYSKIGQVYRSEVYDSSSNLYDLIINKIESHDLGNQRSFVKLTQGVQLAYDGNADHKDQAQSFIYHNSSGNLIRKINYGEVNADVIGNFTDTGNDKLLFDYQYVSGDLNGLILREILTDQSGDKQQETKYYYDNLGYGQAVKGNLTKQEIWLGDSDYLDLEKSYNQYGLVIEEKDALNNSTVYTYDQYNLYPISKTNALNQSESYVYDYSSGQVRQLTDLNANNFEIIYDALDRVVAEKQPDQDNPTSLVVKTEYQYNDQSMPHQIKQINYLNNSQSFQVYTYLDGLGREIQQRQQAEGIDTFRVKDIVYNNLGQIEKESLPYFAAGSAYTSATANNDLYTSYTYDTLLRVITITNALGSTVYNYDQWQTTVTDPQNKRQDFSNDAYGNLIQVNEYNGAEVYQTRYDYDSLGNLLKITDALNNVRNFTYDKLGNRLSAEDLHAASETDFGRWYYAYDFNGNLISRTDPKNQIVNWTYDQLNRVLTEDFTGQDGIEIQYIYDQNPQGIGRLSEVETPDIISRYQYDVLGLLIKETRKIKELFRGFDIDTIFSYDRQGNLKRLTYPGGVWIDYYYNNAGLLESLAGQGSPDEDPVALVNNYDYSPLGQIVLQENANNTRTVNTYDSTQLYRLQNRLTENTLTGEKIQDLNYAYDLAGNILNITDSSDTLAAKTADYTYDDLYRLTQAEVTNTANSSDYLRQYQYDAIGNMVYKTDQGTYNYQEVYADAYTHPQAVKAIADNYHYYDANGNLTSVVDQNTQSETAAYTWDYNNRLVNSGGTGSLDAIYKYDHTGQRISQRVGPDDQKIFYPNKFINGAWDAETRAWKLTLHAYANGQSILSADDNAGMINIYFIHQDHLSGSSALTDINGNLAQVLDYYPFGEIRINDQQADFNEQRKYTGHELDDNTGLYYANARYYDARVGRFISQDPLQGDLDIPLRQNKYSYVLNNPLKLIDPTGLRDKTEHEATVAEHMKSLSYELNTVGMYDDGYNMMKSYEYYTSIIDSLPDGGDPKSFTIINDAIFKWYDNQMGYTDWSLGARIYSDYYSDSKPDKYKCNYFIGETLKDSIGYKNDMYGWFSKNPPLARDWTKNNVKGFGSVKEPFYGDIISFDYEGSTDHVGFYFGEGLYVSVTQGHNNGAVTDGIIIKAIPYSHFSESQINYNRLNK